MIEEKFHIKLSVSAVRKLLKNGDFKSLKCGQIPEKAEVSSQKTFYDDMPYPFNTSFQIF